MSNDVTRFFQTMSRSASNLSMSAPHTSELRPLFNAVAQGVELLAALFQDHGQEQALAMLRELRAKPAARVDLSKTEAAVEVILRSRHDDFVPDDAVVIDWPPSAPAAEPAAAPSLVPSPAPAPAPSPSLVPAAKKRKKRK